MLCLPVGFFFFWLLPGRGGGSLDENLMSTRDYRGEGGEGGSKRNGKKRCRSGPPILSSPAPPLFLSASLTRINGRGGGGGGSRCDDIRRGVAEGRGEKAGDIKATTFYT